MRYFLGFVAVVALVVLVFILVIRGFSGGGRSEVQTELTDYARTQTVMRMTIEGPVEADQEHRSVTVTVGRESNVINLIQGYQDRVLETRSYESNETAYATFLRALHLGGYTRGSIDPERDDSRGVCPTGRIYRFEIITGSDTVQSFWTTSCDGGTFGGDDALIRRLFRAQVPDYSVVVRGTGLN